MGLWARLSLSNERQARLYSLTLPGPHTSRPFPSYAIRLRESFDRTKGFGGQAGDDPSRKRVMSPRTRL